MDTLLPIARRIAERLIARRETIAVAEGSSGGLIAAALLAIPGASAYFLGGAVVYTAAARAALLGVSSAEMAGMRAATEPYAAMLADRMRERLGATWGLAEAGAAGPAWQPLWRSCRTFLLRSGGSREPNTHAADRQRRSRIQHARVLGARACAAGRGDRGLRSKTTAFVTGVTTQRPSWRAYAASVLGMADSLPVKCRCKIKADASAIRRVTVIDRPRRRTVPCTQDSVRRSGCTYVARPATLRQFQVPPALR